MWAKTIDRPVGHGLITGNGVMGKVHEFKGEITNRHASY